MSIEDVTDPAAVMSALAEFDQMGHEAFRHHYGFGKAVRWYVEHDGRLYDSKAVIGVAHKYQFGEALGPQDFYGGTPTNNVLKSLGFTVVNTDQEEQEPPLPPGSTGFWIFAARPDRYRLLDSVRELDEDRWRTSGSAIRAGDRAAIWQYRAGGNLRGVVAFAEVLTDPIETTEPDEHHAYWIPGAEPLADTALRVRVRYTIRPDPPLWLEDAPQGSVIRRLSVVNSHGGTVFRVSAQDWEELVALADGWPDTGSLITTTEAEIEHTVRPGRGQGFAPSVADRLAVEHRAMDVVRSEFQADGWKVSDVYKWKSYDLEASRDNGEERHIEVKGTTGGPEQVFLTRKEVEWARDHPSQCVLAIVHSIALDREESPTVAVGGTLRVLHPWEIDDLDLTVVAYRYIVPAVGDPSFVTDRREPWPGGPTA